MDWAAPIASLAGRLHEEAGLALAVASGTSAPRTAAVSNMARQTVAQALRCDRRLPGADRTSVAVQHPGSGPRTARAVRGAPRDRFRDAARAPAGGDLQMTEIGSIAGNAPGGVGMCRVRCSAILPHKKRLFKALARRMTQTWQERNCFFFFRAENLSLYDSIPQYKPFFRIKLPWDDIDLKILRNPADRQRHLHGRSGSQGRACRTPPAGGRVKALEEIRRHPTARAVLLDSRRHGAWGSMCWPTSSSRRTMK